VNNTAEAGVAWDWVKIPDGQGGTYEITFSACANQTTTLRVDLVGYHEGTGQYPVCLRQSCQNGQAPRADVLITGSSPPTFPAAPTPW